VRGGRRRRNRLAAARQHGPRSATGVPRQTKPGDIAILFRSRSSHREFERELGARGIPTYVYKGLGFFDADEIKDVTALLRYLADPSSELRAAALLRSRFIRLSDSGIAALAPDLSTALLSNDLPPAFDSLDDEDRRVLAHARTCAHGSSRRIGSRRRSCWNGF
jgi:ATP-dependent exoDNAse (exonuclease V) beta subunit